VIFWKKGVLFFRELRYNRLKTGAFLPLFERIPSTTDRERKVCKMEFFKNIGKAVGEAASYLGEKNRRAAKLSRIRSVIRAQEKAAQTEYLALGRYYYHALRDKENPVTEPHCASLDRIEAELDNALDQLNSIYGDTGSVEVVTLEGVEPLENAPEDLAEEAPQEAVPQETAPVEAAPKSAPAAQETTPGEAALAEDNDSLPFEG
jgi:hypothetical protein